MPNITIENCPICGSRDRKKVFDAVDHFSTKEIFPVYACLNCGFRFTGNFPSEESIGRYYDSKGYISHSDSKEGIINKLYHFFRKRMLKKKVDIIAGYFPYKSENQSTRLLDIGCGTGYFLDEAKERGFSVLGVEKDANARKHAALAFGLDVKDEKSLWGLEDESFEVITLWHVLEHMEKLNEAIKKIKSCLTPNGILLLALPNHHSYDAKIYKEHWAAYDIPRHLWHFSPDTLEKLLNNHQCKIIKRITMPLDAFYISLLSEKYRGSRPIFQYARAFLVGITGLLNSLRDTGQSSSIIYIVQKEINHDD